MNYLTGGAGDDLIFASAGLDIITELRDGDFTLTNTSLVLNLFGGAPETDTYNTTGGAIDQANLTGGDHNNTLNAAAFTGSVTLCGGAGNDTLSAPSTPTLIGEAGDDSPRRQMATILMCLMPTTTPYDTVGGSARWRTDTSDFAD